MRTRVPSACSNCRRSKLKCSGTEPCDRCCRRAKQCVYNPVGISTPARVARHDLSSAGANPITTHPLDSAANADWPRSSTRRTVGSLSPNQTHLQSVVSALADSNVESPSLYQRNRPHKTRRWLFLGASSTWSFNLRIARLVQASLEDPEARQKTLFFFADGDAYAVSWQHLRATTGFDTCDLPSLDYAVYITSTVNFRMENLLKLFDEETFLSTLRSFYQMVPEDFESHRMWYTQFLLVLAFGKGFLNQKKLSGDLAGSDYFARAMNSLPEMHKLHEDPVIGVEVLTMVALYFYCLDMRQTAYSYIGMAMRLALAEGNHTSLVGSQLEPKLAERCTSNCWSVYVLDRILTCTVGAPLSVHDAHIKNALPTQEKMPILRLHVQLSRLMANMLSDLYSADGSLEVTYLSSIRSILRQLAAIADEIERVIDLRYRTSLDTVPKEAAHLRLLYHQCIILATRPLLLCLVQYTLGPDKKDPLQAHDIFSPAHDLIQTCIHSASKTLRMLAALSQHQMLDTFLPFDMDFACTAASVLIVADEVLHHSIVVPEEKALANNIFHEMDAAGNAAARLRHRELQQLRDLADLHRAQLRAASHSQRRPSQRTAPNPFNGFLLPADGRFVAHDLSTSSFNDSTGHYSLSPHVWEPTPSNLAQSLDLSQNEMLLTVNQLDVEGLAHAIEFGMPNDGDWFQELLT